MGMGNGNMNRYYSTNNNNRNLRHYHHRVTRNWEDLLPNDNNPDNENNSETGNETLIPTSAGIMAPPSFAPSTAVPTPTAVPTATPTPAPTLNRNGGSHDSNHDSAVNGTLTILILLSVIFCFIWAPTFLRRCDPRYSDRRRREAETLRAAGEAAIRAIENSLAEDNRLPHGMTLEERRDFICNVLVTNKVSGKPISSSMEEPSTSERGGPPNHDPSETLKSKNMNNSHTDNRNDSHSIGSNSQSLCIPVTNSSTTTNNNKNHHLSKKLVLSEDWKAGTVPDTDTCAICLLEYEEGDEICWSHNKHCHHAFHKECMLEWLLRHDECPCCRHHYLSLDDEDYDDTDNEEALVSNSPQNTLSNNSSLNTTNTAIERSSSSINRQRLSNFFIFTTRPPTTSNNDNNNDPLLEMINQSSNIRNNDTHFTTENPVNSAQTLSPVSDSTAQSSPLPIIQNQTSINDGNLFLTTNSLINSTPDTSIISPNTNTSNRTTATTRIESPNSSSYPTHNNNNGQNFSSRNLTHQEEPNVELNTLSGIQNNIAVITADIGAEQSVEEISAETTGNNNHHNTMPQVSSNIPFLTETSFVIDENTGVLPTTDTSLHAINEDSDTIHSCATSACDTTMRISQEIDHSQSNSNIIAKNTSTVSTTEVEPSYIDSHLLDEYDGRNNNDLTNDGDDDSKKNSHSRRM